MVIEPVMAPPNPAATIGSPNRVVKLTISPVRVRQWINRLPFFTRIVLVVIVVVQFASLFTSAIATTCSLQPSQLSIFKLHRLNTFPFVHSDIIQGLTSLIALIPLMERFESEHGTLITVAMFMGPFSTLPGGIYIVIDHLIFGQDHAIMGASIWVFLLLACEAVKQGRAHPSFNVSGYQIPTWTTTIVVILFLNFIIPNTSLLGHLCAAVVGYGFEMGPLKFLVPPERVLRWIESRLNLLLRLPHYISVDQKTLGRYGVLPSARESNDGAARSYMTNSSSRLGP